MESVRCPVIRIATGTGTPARTRLRAAVRRKSLAAGMPTLRMYDLRHTAITNMLANPKISEKTTEDTAGHIRASTKRKYSHIRRQYREQAAEALLAKKYAMRERRARERKEKATVDRSTERVLDAIEELTKSQTQLTEALGRFIAQMAEMSKPKP